MAGKQTHFSDKAADAIRHVNQAHLTHDYPGADLAAKGKTPRPNHNGAHNTRVVGAVGDVMALAEKHAAPKAQPGFQKINAEQDQLSIAASFLITGREGEGGRTPDVSERGQQHFDAYRQKQATSLTQPEAGIAHRIIGDPYLHSGEHGDLVKDAASEDQYRRAILNIAHMTDLARCKGPEEMESIRNNVAKCLGFQDYAAASQEAQSGINALFLKAEIKHTLTGGPIQAVLDQNGQFQQANQGHKWPLFAKVSQDADIAMRISCLAEHIKNKALAEQIATALNNAAHAKDDELFNDLLTKVEQACEQNFADEANPQAAKEAAIANVVRSHQAAKMQKAGEKQAEWRNAKAKNQQAQQTFDDSKPPNEVIDKIVKSSSMEENLATLWQQEDVKIKGSDNKIQVSSANNKSINAVMTVTQEKKGQLTFSCSGALSLAKQYDLMAQSARASLKSDNIKLFGIGKMNDDRSQYKLFGNGGDQPLSRREYFAITAHFKAGFDSIELNGLVYHKSENAAALKQDDQIAEASGPKPEAAPAPPPEGLGVK